MKTIIARCATYIALSIFTLLTFFTSGAFAAIDASASIPTTEMVTIRKGDTLWAIATAQQLPREDWPKYWKEACALSKIACTHDAWKKLAVGTVITVPRSADAIFRDKQLQRDAMKIEESTNNAIALAIKQKLDQSVKDMTEKESKLLVRFQTILMILSTFALIATGILLTIMVKGSAERRASGAKLTEAELPHKEPPILTRNDLGPWHPT